MPAPRSSLAYKAGDVVIHTIRGVEHTAEVMWPYRIAGMPMVQTRDAGGKIRRVHASACRLSPEGTAISDRAGSAA